MTLITINKCTKNTCYCVPLNKESHPKYLLNFMLHFRCLCLVLLQCVILYIIAAKHYWFGLQTAGLLGLHFNFQYVWSCRQALWEKAETEF